MSGRCRPNFGVSTNSAGDASIWSLMSRKLKKLRMPAQAAGLRGLFAAALEKPAHVTFDHRLFDLVGRYVPLAQDEMGELPQVAHIRFDGILRERFSSLI